MALSYLKNVYVWKTHTCLGLISIHVVLRLRIVTQSSFTISALNTSAHSQAACNYRRQISGFDKQRRSGTCDLLTSQPWTTTSKTSWNKHRKNTVMIPRVINLQQTNWLAEQEELAITVTVGKPYRNFSSRTKCWLRFERHDMLNGKNLNNK